MFNISDFILILQWWIPFFLLGLTFLPLTFLIFNKFFDKGYLFSKVIGIGVISYLIFLLNVLHILKFNTPAILFCAFLSLIVNVLIYNKKPLKLDKPLIKIIIFEEVLFLSGILFWSFIRAHEPSINGLEKFMDFGFLNSILRTDYQPAVDMWFPPFPINYYYFGHLTTAVLTKVSFLPSFITYNMMLSTLFSFTFVLAFSLGGNLISKNLLTRKGIVGGLLSGLLLSLGGNLHALYIFFKPYQPDHPVSFFNLVFSPTTIPNDYWYPNATRFIPFTIHEFPIYSFVVSDLHGHVVDIMYVLLGLATIYLILIEEKIGRLDLVFISFFLAIMYMTNAWDGAIYLLLLLGAMLVKNINTLENKRKIALKNIELNKIKNLLTASFKPFFFVLILFLIFSFPFNFHFKPFASGIGVLCAPKFLTDLKHVGPLLFEENHCQKSPLWQLSILYGFFYFFVVSFAIFIFRTKDKILKQDVFILLLIALSALLIIIPEFFYVKDIYPAHYRANTMFKLVYQAFMMLMIVSSYSLVRIISKTKNLVFYLLSVLILFPILVYPYFAINSYYGNLKEYKGLDGTVYLKSRYPDDYDAINFINDKIRGRPVIVEAQGDSYTDYARISANTGLPTILGWTVHEWLWRGTYDLPAPRIAEVKDIYESPDLNLTKKLLKKYDARYVFIGNLEHQKYPNLIESKFANFGKIVFSEGQTKIYKLNSLN